MIFRIKNLPLHCPGLFGNVIKEVLESIEGKIK
jgi:hypothetical protein